MRPFTEDACLHSNRTHLENHLDNPNCRHRKWQTIATRRTNYKQTGLTSVNHLVAIVPRLLEFTEEKIKRYFYDGIADVTTIKVQRVSRNSETTV